MYANTGALIQVNYRCLVDLALPPLVCLTSGGFPPSHLTKHVGRNNQRALRRIKNVTILLPCLITVAPGTQVAPISSPLTCYNGMATIC